jgi:hypothetical protein
MVYELFDHTNVHIFTLIKKHPHLIHGNFAVVKLVMLGYVSFLKG